VGYRTEAEARAALAFLNQTFLGTLRLVLEAAMPCGSQCVAEVAEQKGELSIWKRRQQQQQGGWMASQKMEEGAGDEATAAAAKAKKQRRVSKDEFWATMMPRSQTNFWGNDEVGQCRRRQSRRPSSSSTTTSRRSRSSSSSSSSSKGSNEPRP